MKKASILIFSFFLSFVGASGQVSYQTFEQTKLESEKDGKPILMIFAGSDWCRPCIIFKQTILETEEFKTYAAKNFHTLYLDFPAHKKNKLPPNQEAHHRALADIYNSEGAFPKILVLDAKGEVKAKLKFHKQTTADFISECEPHTKRVPLFKAQKELLLMGSRFGITVVSLSEEGGWKALEKGIEEIRRIEALISSWDSNSITSQVNKNAGIKAVKVPEEYFNLVNRCKSISMLTDGYFDISFAGIYHLYSFQKEEEPFPDSSLVEREMEKVNWQNIVLDSSARTIYLRIKGMKIGFGAIGKGYAAMRAYALMSKEAGVKGGLVNASGDLYAWGVDEQGDEWKINILDPRDKTKILGQIRGSNVAVVTSGDYEKYFTNRGSKYAHVINPKTGFPTNEVISATVICNSAELADALATALMVLGKDGIELVNNMKGVESLLVLKNGDTIQSNNLKLKYE